MTKADEVIRYAQDELGKPYVFGDEGPATFDCSGLMQWIFGKVGVKLPRIADQQQRYAKPVAKPLPGDLVFWGNPAHHVALYIGNNRIIAAPYAGANVRVESLAGKNPPTGYGRVPGVGTAAAPLLGLATAGVSSAAGAVGNLLGGVRHVVLESTFAAAGLVLAAWGVYLLAKPRMKAMTRGVTGG